MKTLNINLTHKSYSIFIEKGLFNSLGIEIQRIYKGKKIAIITDKNIDRLYGEKIKTILESSNFEVYKLVIEPGEKSKSMEVLLHVYNMLLQYGIKRSDMIIAFGGGVIGDLSGFAAATLLRGIPFIQIPASLLAQIDSSIGGKVGIDLPQGKNLVGRFYHPEAVFIDPELLKTLDKRFLYDGMAEVIKYGCIKDKSLFFKLMDYEDEDELLDDIEEIIYNCCSIKKDAVEKDEKDMGERMMLNFGHTIGHAIEKYFNYDKYTHGEAVAAGMYTITKNSEALGLTEAGTSKLIKEILEKYNLPYEISGIDKEEILKCINLDKKAMGDKLNIILLKQIGESYIKSINKEDMRNILSIS